MGMTNLIQNNNYENKALLYAEKYGIFKYSVEKNIMTYEESFSGDTYVAKVDLKTMKETRVSKKKNTMENLVKDIVKSHLECKLSEENGWDPKSIELLEKLAKGNFEIKFK